MKHKYECEICGQLFDHLTACRAHEANHFSSIDKIKYELIYSTNRDICDYCKNSYYAYGSEQDCQFKECLISNFYKDFCPTEPLHNKRSSGGV